MLYFIYLILEKRRPRCPNPMEPGSSHMISPEDVAGIDSPTLFDSFEEMELAPMERPRTLKSRRSRDGENPRDRSKNMTYDVINHTITLKPVVLW